MSRPVWTADTAHFTVDESNGRHLADGFHTHRSGFGKGKGRYGQPQDVRRLKADDRVLIKMMQAFVRRHDNYV